ncbi:Uncharacterised protein [Listeria fleischmannii subsp. fleischmannii]|uniref:Gram-positive cocci surface proteins LPxTG domain-containing protein n=2 Tax=Listeria fleischmannii TaxID=1069827 RepID=A0A2X3J846_9LIST|nr:hypothetical protein LFLEISCH_12630 [Listeria fleischmannii subsp. fleischmannii LU2006-1]SQC70390.1 Uncharacterised protein [Listeria fleischmannii subsp. fleischmannii]
MRFLFVSLILSMGIIIVSPVQSMAQDVNSYNSNGQISFYGNNSTNPDTPPNIPPGDSNGGGVDNSSGGNGNSGGDTANGGASSGLGGSLPHTGDTGNFIEIVSGIGLLSLSLILMRKREQEGF